MNLVPPKTEESFMAYLNPHRQGTSRSRGRLSLPRDTFNALDGIMEDLLSNHAQTRDKCYRGPSQRSKCFSDRLCWGGGFSNAVCQWRAYIHGGPKQQYIPRGPYHLFGRDGAKLMVERHFSVAMSRRVSTTECDLGSFVVPDAFSGFTIGCQVVRSRSCARSDNCGNGLPGILDSESDFNKL
ncbi:uncharacterized protein J3R85_004392 [Psidium guajava]|nr:uncharacterized protein J3R85_004392 [Psidium guajava]